MAQASLVGTSQLALTGPNRLRLDFGRSLPAAGKLFCGGCYGRLAGADGGGRGNAIYDHGLPIWVGAHGLAVGGLGARPAAARD